MSPSLHALGFPLGLQVLDQIDPGLPRITLRARPMARAARCPECGTPSRRVHAVYWRCLGDLASFGRPTVLRVRVRRFRCTVLTCPRRTFAEPLIGVAPARARQTDRLRTIHRVLGLALGGNPGARTAVALGLPISRSTLLARVRQGRMAPVPPVIVLGVDDWAWRKGRRYGTILCDLERRRAIDLLPDRAADTLAAWLTAHPGVDIIVRDRAGAYAEGASRGAPAARQVADRWHLLRNGGDALREVLARHHRELEGAARTAAQAPNPPAAAAETAPPPLPAPERPPRAAARRSRAAQERRDARFAEAARLRERGVSISGISRALGAERKTVRRWLRAGQAPTWRHAQRGRSLLDPYRAHLEARWQEGQHNAAALWRELRSLGFPGQSGLVRAWATQRRHADPPLPPADAGRPSAPITPAVPPTPRRAARLLTSEPDALPAPERRFVDALRERSPSLATAVDLTRRFTALVKERTVDAFDTWLQAAEGSALANFAAGIRRDEAAVRAALTEPWSGGPVEGQVNRLKVIKREMYGRAGFDLLRARVLAHS